MTEATTATTSRGRRPPKHAPTKSDFIRANRDLTAREVVAKAKAARITLTKRFVYKVRTYANAAGGPPGKHGRPQAGGARRSRASAKARPKATAAPKATGSDAAFRRLALDLGLPQARALLDDLERRLAALLGS